MLTKLSALLDILYPKICVGCSTYWSTLCPACTKTLQAHSEICPSCHEQYPNYRTCLTCRKTTYPLEGILIVFQYTSYIKTLIASLKYHHTYTLAPFLASKISLVIQSHPLYQFHQSQIALTSIPSHRIRKHRIKWYNQSELLAKEVAKQLSLSYIPTTKRRKRTKSQVKLSRKKRLTNLIGVFENIPCTIPKEIKILIVIDDITTTWSTLVQAAKQIKKQHPDILIRGAVVARHWA